MTSLSLSSLLIAGAYLLPAATAAINVDLVGTWTTKSAKVFTGPGFYNPVNDSFIEPSHTGISYSFTANGYYEEAYYRAISNPRKPNCPEAILQFQHGTVVENADGSLVMTPFAVDGRELLSNPCLSSNTSLYTRYNQPETMKKYTVTTDAYKGVKRLDLFQFNGAPMNPMFLAYNPPQMLPTITMNPTQGSSTTASAATATGRQKRTIAGVEYDLPLNRDAKHIKRRQEIKTRDDWNANYVWWAGVAMTVVGSAAYLL